MKNRTIIGAICIMIALIICFGVAPVVTQANSDDAVNVVMLKNNVSEGTQIIAGDVTLVAVNKSAIPSGAVYSADEVIGLYAKTDLYSGDFVTTTKVTEEVGIATAEDVFSTLNGDKVAISFKLDSYAASLSGKLQNGDIISLIVTDPSTGEIVIPDALQYVQVITTTTSDGIDKDNVAVEDDGSFTSPSTITVLVTPYQARLITMYQSKGNITTCLVCRGDSEIAYAYIAQQDAYLESLTDEETIVVDVEDIIDSVEEDREDV